MPNYPVIERIEITHYRFPMRDIGEDLSFAVGPFYEKGSHRTRKLLSIKIFTDEGVTGEFASGAPGTLEQMQAVAPLLIGANALEREKFYNQAKTHLRKNDRMGIGPLDITLWDLAGKYYNTPVYRLLGGHRTKLPAYASTYHGDRTPGGLNSPEAFADFAEQCLEMGYKGFKLHTWADGNIEREIATIKAVGDRVGGKMALMSDPCCVFDTYGDTLRVGWACDDAGFFWYEDPMRDGGVSLYMHKQLRAAIKTPLLQGEHVHMVEAHTDMAIAEATDFFRADAEYDGGITGVMKIAHAAEGFGLDLELHTGGPAHRHTMAAIRNSNFYELGLVHPLLGSSTIASISDFADNLDSIDSDGYVSVPEGPGLGVTYDWDRAKEFLVDRIVIDAKSKRTEGV